MKHVEPPENLPVVPDEPAPMKDEEPAEDVHFRDRRAGDTLNVPKDAVADERPLGECPSTTNEASPMKNEKSRREGAAFMTTDELAAWLGVGRHSVYSLVRKDGMPCYRFAGTLRFQPEEVEAFLKSRHASGDQHGGPAN